MYVVGGALKRKKLLTLKGDETRPTASKLREALFNICQHQIEGADFLDLFAGIGGVGIEAISRGALSATFIEKESKAYRLIEKNIDALGIGDKCQLVKGDVLQVLERSLSMPFDIIFADPPYGLQKGGVLYSLQLLTLVDQNPLLKDGGSFFLEEGIDNLEPVLEHLTLVSKRRYGRSFLYQYRKGVF